MQPVRTDRQVRRPDDDAIAGLALRDNLKTGNDFPAQRERGSLLEFGPRGPAGPDHHRLAEKPVRVRAGRASRMILSAAASVTCR